MTKEPPYKVFWYIISILLVAIAIYMFIATNIEYRKEIETFIGSGMSLPEWAGREFYQNQLDVIKFLIVVAILNLGIGHKLFKKESDNKKR